MIGLPSIPSVLLFFSIKGFEQCVKGVLEVAIDDVLSVPSNSGEKFGFPVGVLTAISFISGVLPTAFLC